MAHDALAMRSQHGGIIATDVGGGPSGYHVPMLSIIQKPHIWTDLF